MRNLILGFVIGLSSISLAAQSDIKGYQPWAVSNTLGIGATTLTLQASPGTNRFLVVRNVICTILVSAAQAMDVDGATGTPDIIRIPASAAVGLQYVAKFDNGIPLAANDSLRMTSAVAGPSMFCIADGYIRGN